MEYIDKIVDIYKREENDAINEDSLEAVKVAGLYMFYHYFNADTTKLDELNQSFCFLKGDVGEIIAINSNYYEEDALDFITVLPGSIMSNIKLDFKKIFVDFLKKVNENVAKVICREENATNEYAISRFDDFDGAEKKSYHIIVLCNYPQTIEEKIWYQKTASEYKVKNDSIKFEILFEDDILEEVSDIESPKEYVQSGKLILFDGTGVAFFGEEKSFLCFISANSLKENYFLYSTHGLFASNLRYYIKSAKIDSQITNTIETEPENFCYYNNGIIVTCDDYKIKNNKISLENFSIVNGGQTTNLVGRTSFNSDFAIMCKVIKNKYDDVGNKVDFLAKVAEASNTQKPIKAKDLIANRKEQRMLKIQFNESNIFLQVKRGEKINKDVYKEPWQNATNDNVAQMLSSLVYQMPGSAKNAKSKLLENDRTYNKLFVPVYNSSIFVSLQHIKVAYNNWVKKLKKKEPFGSVKLGLAKNSDLLILGVIGLLYKMEVNSDLLVSLTSIPDNELGSDNESLKFLIGQNDIGELNLLNQNLILNIGKSTLFDLFDRIFEAIIIPAYERFKRYYPNYSYSNFVKSDMYYINYVVYAVIAYKKKDKKKDFVQFFDVSKSSNVCFSRDESFDNYKPGLEEELIEYRKRTYRALDIKAYEVFKNIQLTNIIKYKPKTLSELKQKARLTDYQCQTFGEAIIKIVSKYGIKDYIE